MKQRRKLTALVLLLSLSPAFGADSDFIVDVFWGWGGYYRPMEWTPVEIGINSRLTEPFGGRVVVSALQDELNTLNVEQSFVLTPGQRLTLPLVTKLAFAADSWTVVVTNERGRTVWKQTQNLFAFGMQGARQVIAANDNDLLIGLVGGRKFGLSQLPSNTQCKSQRGGGQVYLEDKLPRWIPRDWTGFVSLDLLILYDPDWALFHREQLRAIGQWVSNGGKLLVVLGSNRVTTANPLAELIPFEIQSPVEVTLAPSRLADWGLDGSGPESVTAWPLRPTAQARFLQADAIDDQDALFASSYVGFGRVGVLGFDPANLSDKQKSRTNSFWISRLTAILEDERAGTIESPEPLDEKSLFPGLMPGMMPDSSGMPGGRLIGRRSAATIPLGRSIVLAPKSEGDDNARRDYYTSQFEIGWAQAGVNAVMEHLYRGMEPLSIWYVILLLSALAILLGPVDYLVLKRLGRLPLTWVTSAFWIALFTVGAYYGVQAIRAGEMELRVVSILDGIENESHAWSTQYASLFAPSSDDYRFQAEPAGQWWSGISPTQDYLYAYNRAPGSRKIYCVQQDGYNFPASLPINIWDRQCLLNESSLEQLPLRATVAMRGNERVITIENISDSPIAQGYVLFAGDLAVAFDGVAPHSTEEFTGALQSRKSWDNYVRTGRQVYYYGSDEGEIRFENEAAYSAQGCLQRTQAIRTYLAHGAAVVCAEYDQASVDFTVEDRNYTTEHIQLVRLVVFPKSDEGI